MRNPAHRALALLAAALLLAAASPPASATAPEALRFRVLQAAVHPVLAPNATHQSASSRVVLLENFVDGTGEQSAASRDAAYGLLNDTSAGGLAYAEFSPSSTRFVDYYRGSFVPTAIFDGQGEEFGGNAQTREHFDADYAAKAAVPAGASINVTGSIAITRGFIQYEVYSNLSLPGYRVVVRAFLVEDHVTSAVDGGDLRNVVRAYLPGDTIELLGNSYYSGQLNFTVEASWAQSRLLAIVFVQVDAPPPVIRTPAESPFDIIAAIIVPLSVLATGVIMALIFLRYIRAERQTRYR